MSVKYTDNSKRVKNTYEAAIHRALETIGGMAETYAKLLAPVDTGRLRNSITHMVDDKGDERAAVIGTNVEYAPYVELGTRKQHPKPYLRPAIENRTTEYRQVLEREVNKYFAR